MRLLFLIGSVVFALALTIGCAASGSSNRADVVKPVSASPANTIATTNSFPVIHVFVALCDNVNQGIVPVSATLGNGDKPETNLYWGAAFGVKTFFAKNKEWELVSEINNPEPRILDRIIFKRRDRDVFIVADAYQGKEIAQATRDFLGAASGEPGDEINVTSGNRKFKFNGRGSSDLVVYVGHDGLMDFKLQATPTARDSRKRKAIILACVSKAYFAKPLEDTGAEPLLWTTGLMAPEAYILSAALEGWLNHETNEQVRARAARAYHTYQKCGMRAANGLFTTGW
jgi:hypothetical protein